MGKKDPQTVPQPDPYEVARADAQFNRIDQYTPYGNLIFSGPERNRADLTLSPELQGIFDSRLQTDQSMMDEANYWLNNYDRSPIDLSQFGDIQSNIDPTGINFTGMDTSGLPPVSVPALSGYLGMLPQFQELGNGMPLQTSIQNSTLPQFDSNAGDIQNSLDTSGLPAIPQDLEQYRTNVEDAYFQRARRLLEPQFQRQEESLRDTLANQGLPTTGEAFLDQYSQFNTDRGNTFANVADQAVMASGQEMSRLLADALAARNQGFGERLTQGQFTNQAQGQQFGQNLAGYQANLAGAGQQFSQNLAEGQFANQAAAQDFATRMQQAGFNNQQIQQMFENQMGVTGFNNAVGQQNFGNEAALRQMLFGEDLTANQQNNAASQMNLMLQQQMLQNQNAGRTMALNEALQLSGNDFNRLASFLGLQQIQSPQMQNFYAPGQADVIGANQLAQNAGMFNANQANQMNAAALSGLYGLGAAGLTGGLGMFGSGGAFGQGGRWGV